MLNSEFNDFAKNPGLDLAPSELMSQVGLSVCRQLRINQVKAIDCVLQLFFQPLLSCCCGVLNVIPSVVNNQLGFHHHHWVVPPLNTRQMLSSYFAVTTSKKFSMSEKVDSRANKRAHTQNPITMCAYGRTHTRMCTTGQGVCSVACICVCTKCITRTLPCSITRSGLCK